MRLCTAYNLISKLAKICSVRLAIATTVLITSTKYEFFSGMFTVAALSVSSLNTVMTMYGKQLHPTACSNAMLVCNCKASNVQMLRLTPQNSCAMKLLKSSASIL